MYPCAVLEFWWGRDMRTFDGWSRVNEEKLIGGGVSSSHMREVAESAWEDGRLAGIEVGGEAPYPIGWDYGESFTKLQRKFLLNRLARFVALIQSGHSSNLPPIVVAKELAGVVQSAVAIYGSVVYAEMSKPVELYERMRLGFCLYCFDEPIGRAVKNGRCGKCNEQLDASLEERLEEVEDGNGV